MHRLSCHDLQVELKTDTPPPPYTLYSFYFLYFLRSWRDGSVERVAEGRGGVDKEAVSLVDGSGVESGKDSPKGRDPGAILVW